MEVDILNDMKTAKIYYWMGTKDGPLWKLQKKD